jgi:hypothetical protein
MVTLTEPMESLNKEGLRRVATKVLSSAEGVTLGRLTDEEREAVLNGLGLPTAPSFGPSTPLHVSSSITAEFELDGKRTQLVLSSKTIGPVSQDPSLPLYSPNEWAQITRRWQEAQATIAESMQSSLFSFQRFLPVQPRGEFLAKAGTMLEKLNNLRKENLARLAWQEMRAMHGDSAPNVPGEVRVNDLPPELQQQLKQVLMLTGKFASREAASNWLDRNPSLRLGFRTGIGVPGMEIGSIYP